VAGSGKKRKKKRKKSAKEQRKKGKKGEEGKDNDIGQTATAARLAVARAPLFPSLPP